MTDATPIKDPQHRTADQVPSPPPAAPVKAALALTGAAGSRAGAQRFELLDAIQRLGSISAAAKAVGLSYRAAWDGVDALNNLFPVPLVEKRPGGKHGGGARLTAQGVAALALHRGLSDHLSRVVDAFGDAQGTADAVDPQALIWSHTMKTSARNVFYGHVAAVSTGPVNAHVTLAVGPELELVAQLTHQSAVGLGIRPGLRAYALIKASSPILARADAGLATSARNRLAGTVSRVERGDVNADVTLDLGGGKSLAAVITTESLNALALEPGAPALALIKASQLIIGVE